MEPKSTRSHEGPVRGPHQAQFATKFVSRGHAQKLEQDRSRRDAPTRAVLAVHREASEAVEDVLRHAG